MTAPTGQSVDEFLATVPDERRRADAHALASFSPRKQHLVVYLVGGVLRELVDWSVRVRRGVDRASS
jgi:hypothetical protein